MTGFRPMNMSRIPSPHARSRSLRCGYCESKVCQQRRHNLLTMVNKVQGPPRYKGPPTCPKLAFKTQVFLPIINTALFQLQSRFEDQHLVSGSFSFLYPKYLLQLSDADLNSAAQKFQETYSADIDSDFVAEVRFFRREFWGEIEASQTVLDLLKLIISYKIISSVISPRTGYCLCIVCYNPCNSGQCRAFLL